MFSGLESSAGAWSGETGDWPQDGWQRGWVQQHQVNIHATIVINKKEKKHMKCETGENFHSTQYFDLSFIVDLLGLFSSGISSHKEFNLFLISYGYLLFLLLFPFLFELMPQTCTMSITTCKNIEYVSSQLINFFGVK